MTAYIAAPYQARALARDVRALLVEAGLVVTSRWLEAAQEDSDAAAREDLADILAADVFIALNPAGWGNLGTGGRHFEMGYAFAKGKPIVLVGDRTQVFHQLSDVVVLASVDQLPGHLLARVLA